MTRLCAASDCTEVFTPNKYNPGQRFCSEQCRKREWAYYHYTMRKRWERYWRLERSRTLGARWKEMTTVFEDYPTIPTSLVAVAVCGGVFYWLYDSPNGAGLLVAVVAPIVGGVFALSLLVRLLSLPLVLYFAGRERLTGKLPRW
jgi:hypothetical protein